MSPENDNPKRGSAEPQGPSEPMLDCLDRAGSAVNLGDTVVPGPLMPESVLDRPMLDGENLAIKDLAAACRIFLELAYPAGRDTIPADRRVYATMPDAGEIADYLPPAPRAVGMCSDLAKKGHVGYEFRLGSADHPHLKLSAQRVEFQDRKVWVFSVDTHDQFPRATEFLQGDQATQWRALVQKNSELKSQIEKALAAAGFLTPIDLLRVDIRPPQK